MNMVQSLLDLCVASQSRILNRRTLCDTIGKFTSFLYNGASAVDYCVVSCLLLNHVRYFTKSLTLLLNRITLK